MDTLETLLPKSSMVSSKFALALEPLKAASPAKAELITRFKWRRFLFEDEHQQTDWVVVPSLSPDEVTAIEHASADPAPPTTPRGPNPTNFLGLQLFSIPDADGSAEPSNHPSCHNASVHQACPREPPPA